MKRKAILVICPNPEKVAPSQRLKYEQYFDYFRDQGFDVTVSSFKSKRFWNIVYEKGYYLEKVFWTCIGYLKRVLSIPFLPFYDAIYIHLDVTPFGGSLFERMYVAMNPNMIYDIDDLVFIGNKSKVNSLTSFLKSPAKYFFLFRNAKEVIVCTPYLMEFAKQYNANVTDISSTIDTERYVPVNRYTNQNVPVLGWSGSHSTLQYLFLLKDVLIELKALHNFRMVVFGVKECSIEGLDISVIPFSEEQEVQALQQIDIGLYPLPLNEQWVYGKSGLKALQYMALGIPTIATKVGANLRIIESDKTGVLVTTKEEWLKALSTFIDNAEMRKKIGMAGRQNVVSNYSINANKDVYLSVLHRVVKS